jgi:very-short-patch-repair endonuclease
MKASPTPSEAALWSALVNKKLGVSFRRQVVIGSFVVDLVAPARKVIVEVDGGCHREKLRADARRDEKLRRLGYRVLRLEAEFVIKQLPVAVALVCEAIDSPRH